MKRTFDRVAKFDSRSKNYVLSINREEPLVSKEWNCDTHLDQGNEGACVGFGCGHELLAEPVVPVITVDYNYCYNKIYKAAQKIDEWPGENYEGTSVLAGVKTLKDLGWCESYNWAFNFTDFLRGLSQLGPSIIGVNWYEGMMDTDDDGFIHPAGEILGGHCVLIKGLNVEDGYVIGHNSWGTSWGIGGDFKITFLEMIQLLQERGEACFLEGRNSKPIVNESWLTRFWEWLIGCLKN